MCRDQSKVKEDKDYNGGDIGFELRIKLLIKNFCKNEINIRDRNYRNGKTKEW